jgi:hypothetical protein
MSLTVNDLKVTIDQMLDTAEVALAYIYAVARRAAPSWGGGDVLCWVEDLAADIATVDSDLPEQPGVAGLLGAAEAVVADVRRKVNRKRVPPEAVDRARRLVAALETLDESLHGDGPAEPRPA